MESYSFLLFLAIIMISTKILGLFTRKIHMPAVVGALVLSELDHINRRYRRLS